MAEYLWHFFLGMIISIWGSIPLGTINLGVIQTTVSRNVRAGIYFAVGATLVELVYSFIAIQYLAVFLIANPLVNLIIQMIAIPVFLLLGILSYKKSAPSHREEKPMKGKSFVEGITLGLLNPLQIPFWVAYTSYLISNLWIKNQEVLLNVFIAGICTGTLIILCIIAVLSKKFTSVMNIGSGYINRIIAFVFFGLAFYQTVKLGVEYFRNPN
ncbi:MAG: LysE family translocator [Cytophagaceae bacterium]